MGTKKTLETVRFEDLTLDDVKERLSTVTPDDVKKLHAILLKDRDKRKKQIATALDYKSPADIARERETKNLVCGKVRM